jgi:CheY-like chemotaxis protein
MPKTIVIIDDDSDDLDIMKEALGQVDPSLLCISFVYPDEAIRLLGKELILLPDYIFIDINIPRISGQECLSYLREIKEFDNIPIIMYSTSMPSQVSQVLMKKGANFTFQKPFEFKDYITILERIIYGSYLARA